LVIEVLFHNKELSTFPKQVHTYGKRLKSGITRPTSVEVYALEFEKQLKKWPERSERQVEWMAVSDAVAAVEEQGLRLLMLRLSEIHLAVVD
jgi:hypothetical protein